MPEHPSVPSLLVMAGIALVIIGLVASTGALSWFGRLPGDIHIERPGVRVYAPFTSMVLVSIIFSMVAALVRWFRQ